jgi:Domain of unknown function (DUF1707)
MTDDISNRPLPAPPDAREPVPPSQLTTALTPVEASALEAARERTIRVLTDRFADDTLSLDEFESRLDRMYKATRVAELDALLREVEVRATRAVSTGAPAYTSATPAQRRLLSIMSNTERTGRWAMPRELHVRALMSSVLLDLREVSLPAGVCEIEVLALMASVEIVVPPGVIVEDLALGVMANVENRALDDGFTPDTAPRIRITGTAVMANIEVNMAPSGLPPRKAIREARRDWRRRLRGR